MKEFDFDSVMQMSRGRFESIPYDKRRKIAEHRIQYLKRELKNPEFAEKVPQMEELIEELQKVLE